MTQCSLECSKAISRTCQHWQQCLTMSLNQSCQNKTFMTPTIGVQRRIFSPRKQVSSPVIMNLESRKGTLGFSSLTKFKILRARWLQMRRLLTSVDSANLCSPSSRYPNLTIFSQSGPVEPHRNSKRNSKIGSIRLRLIISSRMHYLAKTENLINSSPKLSTSSMRSTC